jgi:NADH dehydrogenase FAD-containing subunit
MSVPGHDGLWALGDCAAVPNAHDGRMSPPTAQFADRQARLLARKTRLFLEWNWAMFFPPDIAHLGFRRTRRDPPVRA